MPGLTLRQLEIFAQVVAHGSFRRCADHLGVSQVSVSEHVRELEARLGVPLFERHSGGVSTLTSEGRRAHQRVVAILADIDDLVRDVGGGNADVSRRMAIAIPPFLMRYLGDAMGEFRRSHPHIDLQPDFRAATAHDIVERIRTRQIDMGYFFALDGEDAPDSEIVRLEPLAIFVGGSHPLARKSVVSVVDIRATPAVHLAAGNPIRTLVDRALAQADASGSPLYVEADEYGLILHAVQANQGFVCMFDSAAGDVEGPGGLVRVSLERPLPSLQVRSLLRHSARHDQVAIALHAALAGKLMAVPPPVE